MMLAEARAPGKLILFGEHAVVYGQPAIAVPMQGLAVTVTAETAPSGTGLCILLPDLRRILHVHLSDESPDNALTYTAGLVLKHLKRKTEPDLKLMLHSTLPIAAGFGSGAAVSVALARALSVALRRPLPNDVLNDLVFEVEKLHHGTPSGVDNTVIVYEKPVYFVKGQPLETFTIQRPLHFLVGRLEHATPTHVTVGDVRKLHQKDSARIDLIFERIGQITRQARGAIENGYVEALGSLMNENHEHLRELTVSDESLDHLCEVAQAAGAVGAKMSGGGRGGNMIALVEAETVEAVRAALVESGAIDVFENAVG